MMRKVMLALLLLLAPLSVAQADTPAPQAFAASFVQTRTLPGFEQPLISHGRMRFSATGGFRWEITQPYHYVFEMQDGQAREQLPDGSTRTLDADKTPWLAAVQRIFVSALSGDQAQLKRYFEVSIEPATDGPGRQVTLVPKSDAMGQAIVRITVTEAAPGQPRQLVIDEASGGRMSMRFTPLPDGPGG